MLAANVCAAEFIQKHAHKCLFRVHEGPTPEKLENLRRFLNVSGLTLGGGDKPTTKDYAELAERVRERPDASMIQTMLLRSMQQAVYQPENLGHFGLSYEAYTHFTSPIRRYPDLLVHRTIKAILADKKYKPGKWEAIGEHCSMAERRADDASRDVQSWLKTYYMRDKVGEVYTGKISAVAGFGIFVLLDELYVEGLIHISELGKDYFHFHKDLQAIIGEKSGLRYQLGDAVTVKVMRADLETAQVDFALVDVGRNKGDGGRDGGRDHDRGSRHQKNRRDKRRQGGFEPPQKAPAKPAAEVSVKLVPAVLPVASEPAPAAKPSSRKRHRGKGNAANKPAEAAAAKPVETKPVAAKPVAPKQVETKPVEPKQVDAKQVAPKQVAAKPVEPKQVETKPVAPKQVETKQVAPKQVETKPAVADAPVTAKPPRAPRKAATAKAPASQAEPAQPQQAASQPAPQTAAPAADAAPAKAPRRRKPAATAAANPAPASEEPASPAPAAPAADGAAPKPRSRRSPRR